MSENGAVATVHAMVRGALRRRRRTLLAVSGGLDSMALLDAAAHVCPRTDLVVATFDHGTGKAAVAACALVVERAAQLGVRCVAGGSSTLLSSEADLRRARWSFLRATACADEAAVATAHTADDQLETVVMRTMRGSGARGIAALYAESDVIRPFREISRTTLAAYVSAREVSWVEDPSNATPAYLRNRVRRDLLPAMLRQRPSLGSELLLLSRRAAALRRELDAIVDAHIQPRQSAHGGLDIDADRLAGIDRAGLSVLWPSVVARAGVVMDRRGLSRLVDFTTAGAVGKHIQLSGGWYVFRSRDVFEVRRGEVEASIATSLSLSSVTSHGDWRFRRVDGAADSASAVDSGRFGWTAWLPTDQPLVVRAWQAGDVLTVRGRAEGRKVKRLLSKMGLTGHKRASWPVVLSGTQIVWIPGVPQAGAESDRFDRTELPFMCEYVNC